MKFIIAFVGLFIFVGGILPAYADSSMNSAMLKAKWLADLINKKEKELASDRVVRTDIKGQVNKAFSGVCELFSQGVGKLNDVVMWCKILVGGVHGPNGQQLIADFALVEAELTSTVEIMTKLSQEAGLGLSNLVEVFTGALHALKNNDAKFNLLLKQGVEFAEVFSKSIELLTSIVMQINDKIIDMQNVLVQERQRHGPWALLGQMRESVVLF